MYEEKCLIQTTLTSCRAKSDAARQSIYVKRNIVTCSGNHFCSGKVISITYSEYVFVGLDIQHAIRMRHIVINGLPGSTIFFHFTS